jgi:hypothetical protein
MGVRERCLAGSLTAVRIVTCVVVVVEDVEDVVEEVVVEEVVVVDDNAGAAPRQLPTAAQGLEEHSTGR